jgi:hypothetical protein
MACPARACYNPIDSTVPREFRGDTMTFFWLHQRRKGES